MKHTAMLYIDGDKLVGVAILTFDSDGTEVSNTLVWGRRDPVGDPFDPAVNAITNL